MRHIYILTLVGLVQACSNKEDKTDQRQLPETTDAVKLNPLLESNTHVIEGVIRNAPVRTVVIQEVIPSLDPQLPPQVNRLAETQLDGHDSFHVEVPLTEPLLAMVTTDPAHIAEIVLNGSRTFIIADFDDWSGLEVRGDDQSASLVRFTKAFDRLNEAIGEYQSKFENGRPNPIQMATMDKMFDDLEGFIRGYIDTTTCSACALQATRLLDPSRNFDFLQGARSRIAKTWSASKYVAELDARLAPMTKWIGEFAPDIRLPDVNGKMTPLSSLRGKYVLLDFWASWCAPCRGENPNVVRLYNKYKSRGFTVYSVSLDGGQTRTGRNEWIAAIKADRLTWDAHVSDLQGWQSPVAQLYEINGIPASFLLDKEGRIIAKDLRGQVLERKLAELFGT